MVTVAASTLVVACGASSSPRASAPLRSQIARPREVVSAYLAALDAGDTSAALQLTTPRFQAALRAEVDSPLQNWVSVEGVRVGSPFKDKAVGSARRWREVLYVPVKFTLHQREEVSMRDGETNWGYVVVRNAPSDAWLIDDQGVG